MCPWRGQDWCPLTSDLWAMFLVYSVLPVSGSDLVLADLPLSGPSGLPGACGFRSAPTAAEPGACSRCPGSSAQHPGLFLVLGQVP